MYCPKIKKQCNTPDSSKCELNGINFCYYGDSPALVELRRQGITIKAKSIDINYRHEIDLGNSTIKAKLITKEEADKLTGDSEWKDSIGRITFPSGANVTTGENCILERGNEPILTPRALKQIAEFTNGRIYKWMNQEQREEIFKDMKKAFEGLSKFTSPIIPRIRWKRFKDEMPKPDKWCNILYNSNKSIGSIYFTQREINDSIEGLYPTRKAWIYQDDLINLFKSQFGEE